MPDMPKCEVCNERTSVAVVCVPGCPISCAYCQECINANAHPYHVIVSNTWCAGGYDNCSDWWKEMVDATLKHLDKTREELDADIADADKSYEEYCRNKENA